MNLMVDSNGRITGVLDWWMHSASPAILAADYPPWLRYDGINDPRFAAPGKLWLETPEESTRLRAIYQEVRLHFMPDPLIHGALGCKS
jgi:hypothetical protein